MTFVLIAYVLLVGLAGVWDLTRLVIPNGVPLALTGLFLGAAALLPISVDWLSHIAAGLLGGALAAIPFACAKMGGGDVKFIAALSLWAGLESLPSLLLTTALAGGALAMALLSVRFALGRWMQADQRLPSLRHGGPVPYGAAIAAGGLLTTPGLPFLAVM